MYTSESVYLGIINLDRRFFILYQRGSETVANEENLKKGRRFTEETARENGRKGGIACAEAKRRKKTMSELASLMINSKLEGANKERVQKLCGDVMDEEATVGTLMMAGQIQSAMRGNTNAFNSITMLIEKEEEKQAKKEAEEKAKLNTTYHLDLDMIPDTFHAIFRDIRNRKHQEYVFEGGRGSTKSSDFAQILPELIKNNHDIHAVVVRKVANTLKDSVYNKIEWALGKQNIDEEFDETKSPLEITYKATGQKIYFRGADKPEKIKSIAPPFGYIAIIWFEELDQFTEEEVRNITQSVIRGGEKAWIFKSFNPPKTRLSWVNKYVQTPKDNMIVHHSTYLDVPEEWLGRPFIEEAEHLKEVNPEAYEHEYLGIPNGNGGNVFDYFEIRRITDEEIATFDEIYQGVDWGWYPDIYAFKRLYVDEARKKIYHIAEYICNKTSNEKTAEWILEQGYDDFPITCDSAEPKSINDYRDAGLLSRPAIKGAGSIEYGMKFLQGYTHVIDPERTPITFKEMTEYEYERDKDGNPISGYPDKNNHTIDATRYALEQKYNRRGTSA